MKKKVPAVVKGYKVEDLIKLEVNRHVNPSAENRLSFHTKIIVLSRYKTNLRTFEINKIQQWRECEIFNRLLSPSMRFILLARQLENELNNFIYMYTSVHSDKITTES